MYAYLQYCAPAMNDHVQIDLMIQITQLLDIINMYNNVQYCKQTKKSDVFFSVSVQFACMCVFMWPVTLLLINNE